MEHFVILARSTRTHLTLSSIGTRLTRSSSLIIKWFLEGLQTVALRQDDLAHGFQSWASAVVPVMGVRRACSLLRCNSSLCWQVRGWGGGEFNLCALRIRGGDVLARRRGGEICSQERRGVRRAARLRVWIDREWNAILFARVGAGVGARAAAGSQLRELLRDAFCVN